MKRKPWRNQCPVCEGGKHPQSVVCKGCYWSINRVKSFNISLSMVRLVASDLTMKQIADKMDVGLKTAEYHWRKAKDAFGFKTPVGATLCAIRFGLVKVSYGHTT